MGPSNAGRDWANANDEGLCCESSYILHGVANGNIMWVMQRTDLSLGSRHLYTGSKQRK